MSHSSLRGVTFQSVITKNIFLAVSLMVATGLLVGCDGDKVDKDVSMKTDQQNVIDVIVQHEKIANDFGLSWANIDQVLEQIKNESEGIKSAWLKENKENLEEKIVDLINATLSLAVFCNLNPTELLDKNNQKFKKQFDIVVALAKADGLQTLKGQPLPVLLSYWKKAKQIAADSHPIK